METRMRRLWLLTAAGWLLAAVLAGLLLRAALPRTRAVQPITLLDPQYPPAGLGEPGWDYSETARADLDGDGAPEEIVVIARVQRLRGGPAGEFAWDDGQPWQVYVVEPDGQRTYVYSRWVQLGRLQVLVGEAAAGRSLLIVEEQGAGLGLYRVNYRGPGEAESAALAQETVLTRTSPPR